MYLSCPKFFKNLIEVNNCSPLDRNVYAVSIRDAIDRNFSTSTHLMEATTAKVNYQYYQQGMFLVHGYCSGVPEFCRIIRLLFHGINAYFLCQHYEATFEEHFARFELTSTNVYHVLHCKLLSDFSPLHSYIIHGRLYVVPKRFVDPLENAPTADFE